MIPFPLRCGGACALLATAHAAQGPAFDSPGTPRIANPGQADQFSNEFNPALGLVIDGFADFLDDEGGDDGFDVDLRLLEVNASAWIDPKAWAYVVLTSEALEAPEVEEAALQYVGFETGTTLKAGRFFVDFGKQMQLHPEELRTLERPLPLRRFLGEELAGTGLQVDHWWPVGETTPLRVSVGVFGELLPGAEEEDGAPEALVPERKALDELAVTARVTAMTDVGERGQLQGGLSGRWIPSFDLEFDDGTFAETEEDLSNVVLGLDVTWSTADETGDRSLLLGGEVLLASGDLAGELDDPLAPTDLLVTDDDALGFFVFADHGWSRRHSAGLQLGFAEDLLDPGRDALEADAYYTLHFTEFRRLRLGTTWSDSDVDGETWRAYVQLTAFFGNHSHGFNW